MLIYTNHKLFNSTLSMPKFNPDNLNIHNLTIEEPAEQKLEGRDPKEFLDETFDWISNNMGSVPKEDWYWHILKNQNVVSMHLAADINRVPKEIFYDIDGAKYSIETENEDNIMRGQGIDNLINELNGKRVISIKGQDDWYLKIVDNEPRKEKLIKETPQMPDQKEF